jgi:ribosomal protein S18 acetylase RimI-like enzyme
MTVMSVTYQLEPELSPAAFLDLLVHSTLAERRPSEVGTLESMLKNADLILTARVDGLLVGISRAITDFAYCTYLSDLAVDAEYQGRGIGRELIRQTHEAAGLHTTLILLSAPKAETVLSTRRHEEARKLLGHRPAIAIGLMGGSDPRRINNLMSFNDHRGTTPP